MPGISLPRYVFWDFLCRSIDDMKILNMTREEYFAHPAINASFLKDIDDGEKKFKIKASPTALSFGSLVDAILTQKHEVDTEHPDYVKARQMAERFLKDPFCRKIYENAQKQTVYVDTFSAMKGGINLEVEGKCLFDFDISDNAGADLKTGAFADMKGLVRMMDTFDWDMQVAWYMHISGKKSMSILALSKLKPIPPIVLPVQRDLKDPHYARGIEKVLNKLFVYQVFLK
jgi:hypothetical protein